MGFEIVVRFVCDECGRERRGVATALPISILETGWHPHEKDCTGDHFITQVYEGSLEDTPPKYFGKEIGNVRGLFAKV